MIDQMVSVINLWFIDLNFFFFFALEAHKDKFKGKEENANNVLSVNQYLLPLYIS